MTQRRHIAADSGAAGHPRLREIQPTMLRFAESLLDHTDGHTGECSSYSFKVTSTRAKYTLGL
jgi:hypothetical protein